ncbi:AAA family ATPase [Burkholderia multivorans]|nr:AAA family ATPase [Burkholderia multivorans]KWF76088.1 AAA family ATPase [Burkholderia multivorans]
MSMAAIVSRAGEWPDDSVAESGNVLIWSGEDDPQDTLAPRLMSAGADLNRIHFVTATRVEGKVRPFDPAQDMSVLKETCEKIGNVRLIILDPIVSAVSGDSHKNTETRRALQPVVELAMSIGAALLGITHFNKGKQGTNPALWLNGSVAFTAVARVVMIAAKVKRDGGEDVRVFARAKSNIGPDGDGFEYQIEQSEPKPGIPSSCIAWGEALTGSAHDLLASKGSDGARGGSAANSAREFLGNLLNGGDLPAKTVEAEAESAGIALRTLRRASDAMRIEKYKGKDGKWYWSLPESANMANVSDME